MRLGGSRTKDEEGLYAVWFQMAVFHERLTQHCIEIAEVYRRLRWLSLACFYCPLHRPNASQARAPNRKIV